MSLSLSELFLWLNLTNIHHSGPRSQNFYLFFFNLSKRRSHPVDTGAGSETRLYVSFRRARTGAVVSFGRICWLFTSDNHSWKLTQSIVLQSVCKHESQMAFFFFFSWNGPETTRRHWHGPVQGFNAVLFSDFRNLSSPLRVIFIPFAELLPFLHCVIAILLYLLNINKCLC